MFVARDVLRVKGRPNRDYRVVFADMREVVLFDLASDKTVFQRRKTVEVQADVEKKRIVLLLDHDYDRRKPTAILSEAQVKRRDRMASVIRPVLAQVPAVFDDRFRGSAVSDVVRDTNVTSKTVHGALHRYWRYGMSDDALVASFDRCGCGDRSPDAKRVGRKQPEGAPQGVVITPKIKAIFDKAIKRHYATTRKNSLVAAYEMMRAEEFVLPQANSETGDIDYVPRPEYREFWFSDLAPVQVLVWPARRLARD